MFKHILLPTDGSDGSLRAIGQGAELAAAIGAQVTVMTAIEHFPHGIMGGVYQSDTRSFDQAMHDVAVQRLDAAQACAVQAAAGKVLPCHRILVRDKPVHQAIIEAAQTCDADLIVMSTHGLSAIDRLLIGSQTQRVLARTGTPVLVVR